MVEEPVVSILQGEFARMPAAIFAGVFVALMVIGLWASMAAWRSARILVLVARTPGFNLSSGPAAAAGSVVKIHGVAQPEIP